MAGFEEAVAEEFEPLFDGGKVVGSAAFGGEEVGPAASVFVGPGVPAQVGDFAGAEAEAGDVVDVEVLKVVGADFVGGFLGGGVFVAFFVGDEFGGDFGFEDALKNFAGFFVELGGEDAPAD